MPPLHRIGELTTALTIKGLGSVMITEAEFWHPLPSVTKMVYVPGFSAVAFIVVAPFDHK